MAQSDVAPLSNFDCNGDATSVGPRWKRWRKAFQYYVEGKGINNHARMRALLLHTAGMDVQDIFETLDEIEFVQVEDEEDNVYKQSMRKLDSYFTPKLNVPYERHVFRACRQESDETVDQYVTRLKKQALNCEFGDDNGKADAIRDQVIDTCRSSHLRRKLLQRGHELTLPIVLDTARAMEAVDQQSKRMEASVSNPKHSVNRVHTSSNYSHKSYEKKGQSQGQGQNKSCFRCGIEGHFSKDPVCPARNATCNKCGYKGHYSGLCKTKTENRFAKDKDQDTPKNRKPGEDKGARPKSKKQSSYNMELRDDSSDEDYAFHVRAGSPKLNDATIDTKVGGVYIRTLIDSGSTANVVDSETWKYLKKNRVKCDSQQATRNLYPYGSTNPLESLGKFSATVEIGDKSVEASFMVIKGQGRSLLSKATAEELGVLKVGLDINAMRNEKPTLHVNNMKPSTVPSEKLTLDSIKQRYPAVCDGIGKLKGYQAKIHVDPDVKPVAQSQRRIPFAMRDKLEAKIDELLADDIIERVEGPTPWVSPLVIIPKPSGDIRVCVDMRQANTAVIRERHPIPTVDEVLHRMNSSKVFSKIDLRAGFHQIELEEESRSVTTFTCHLGIFRYKRLMFGISSAPELFQHIVQQVLADCEGVENISDDLIVHGDGDAEHDKRLTCVIETLMKNGLTVNLEKCLIRLPELEYMGHVLSGDGITPTQDRVRAVAEARKPQSASEVRSFMGLVNFSARFIPNLATVAEPLRKLTRQSEPFEWGQAQDVAFQKLKDELSKADRLAHFVTTAETEIVVDASPFGLGAMLVQTQNDSKRVICYASRSLTGVERRYSQTEKEALGIVWACERFHQYLYGIHFEIATDHKPLVFIYSPKSKPSARIERWVLRLQPYDFTVKHIPGKEMAADALSRLVERTEHKDENIGEEYVHFIAETATPRALKTREIERESEKDEKLCVIRQCLETGNWDSCPQEFKCVRNELCAVGKLVLRGCRIVIPETFRARVVQLAHEGHLGIVKTKERLRSKVWWPGIDRDAEKLCRSCHGCQLVAQPSYPEPMKRFEMPTLPWQDTAADLLGPMPDGEYILAIVDYYSRFVAVEVIRRITTDDVIRCLNQVFATHGYPLSLKTDNGRQFVSEEFESYLEENGIEHRLSPPLWPQANGEIERQNRTILKSMRIAHSQGKDWKRELYKSLLAYRTTPHETTGETPSKMLFKREIRSKLPEYREDHTQRELAARDRDAEQKQKGKDYADQRRNAKESNLEVGDQVLMQQPKRNKLSTRYAENPLVVVDKTGSRVTVETDGGTQYIRNSAQLRKFERESVVDPETEADDDFDVPEPVPLESTSPAKLPTPLKTTRSGRVSRIPEKFRDFEI
jgi:hypothetical protein